MPFTFQRYIKPLLPHVVAGLILSGFYLIWLMNVTPVQGVKLIFVVLYLWAFFSLAAYLTWTYLLAPRLAAFSLRGKGGWLFGCLVAGFWLADNIPVVLPGAGVMKLFYFLSAGVGIGLVLFAFSAFFVTRYRPPNPPVQRRMGWLVFALPMLIAWLVYLLAFWPGMMSSDSLDQWRQVLTGQYNDHHPAFHTLTIWLLTRIAPTPAVVALAQIVSLALVVGMILAYLESQGMASKWVWAASLFFAISPVNGTMVVTLWKDVPYSTAVLAFTYLIFRLAQSKGSWMANGGSWLALGVTAALVALFRHNGLPVVVGTFPLLLLFFRRQWKPLAFAFALCLALYLGITGPVYRLAGVEESNLLAESTSSLYNVVASADPGSQASVLLQSIDPLSNEWQCSVGPTLVQASPDNGAGHDETTIEKAQNLVKYAPVLAAYNYRCNRSLVWIVWDPNGEIRNPSHAGYWIDPNPYGIAPASLLPALQADVTRFVLNTAHNPGINWLVWRPALYLYLFLLVVAIAAMRQRNAWIALAAAPVLLQSIGFMLISMPPNFRYHYPVYLLALAFWPVLFLPSQCSDTVKPTSDQQEAKTHD